MLGFLRAFGPPWIRRICGIYVEIFRNIPAVLQLFIWFFAFGLSQWEAAVLALGIFASASVGETYRAGILSIPYEQIESAQSTGLSPLQIARYILIPQAFLIVLPPLATNTLSTVKNTSLAMTIGITELTFSVKEISQRSYRGFEAATAVTIIYLLLSLVIGTSMQALEKKLRIRERVGYR